MRRSATVAETELQPQQQRVIELLVCGTSVTTAAKAAGVSRSTVYRWLREAPFVAAYNRGLRDLNEAIATRLLSLAQRSVDVVEQALDAGDVRAALAILRGWWSRKLPEVGPDDPFQVEQQFKEVELAAQEAEQNREMRQLFVGVPDYP